MAGDRVDSDKPVSNSSEMGHKDVAKSAAQTGVLPDSGLPQEQVWNGVSVGGVWGPRQQAGVISHRAVGQGLGKGLAEQFSPRWQPLGCQLATQEDLRQPLSQGGPCVGVAEGLLSLSRWPQGSSAWYLQWGNRTSHITAHGSESKSSKR